MPNPPKIKRNRELIKKIQSGWSYSQVGEHFNISKATAHEIYHRFAGRKELSPEKDLTTVRS